MREYAIEVNNLSKMFKFYPSQGKRFLDYITFGKNKYYREFWALENISFSIPKGSTFGILGQNGSGKSTLLSILASVLEPSGGSFHVEGKVSAILELGAGFHPDFSGRANIYMYGSIMGLRREDIDERLPEIIHFSELGEFIDQPLRTYSSGMNARLAFSVAVNVDADVLIVDEALAVGDALFQHRCFRKIHELKESGRTILYVGHDTEAVRSLCDQAMILDKGKMVNIGEADQISNEYLSLIAQREQNYFESNQQEYGDIPDGKRQILYNFNDKLELAKKIIPDPSYIREISVDIKNVPRRTIFAHPPSELVYSLAVEEECELAFAIGIYPSAYELINTEITFSIIVNNVQCFIQSLDPRNNPSDRGWHNKRIDLSEFIGKIVQIRFVTKVLGTDNSYCWGGWGWIRLLQGKTSNDISGLKIPIQEGKQICRTGTKRVEIIEMKILDDRGMEVSTIDYGKILKIEVIICANQDIHDFITIGTNIKNKYITISGTNTLWEHCNIPPLKKGETKKIIFNYKAILAPGTYMVTVAAALADRSSREIERFDRYEDHLYFIMSSQKKFEGVVDIGHSIEVTSI